ncbi:MAG TPA: amino acid adenylation domain-containing protein [Steroidobacter sp.]|uniref:non-ribosomal peptide synthetase n=1 Tax=Steroidobacter sp. TaxID=1978227 RepID=UPI002ED8D89D
MPGHTISHETKADATRSIAARRWPSFVEMDDETLQRLAQDVPGGTDNIEDVHPLTPLQDGILFQYHLSKQGDAYVVSTLLELSSHESLNALIRALQSVVERHAILRSAILSDGLKSPIQVVCRRVDLPIEQLSLEPGGLETQMRARMTRRLRKWNLCEPPLMRLQFAHASTERCYVLLQLHHVICDHISMKIVVHEAMTELNGGAPLPPNAVAYRARVTQAVAEANRRNAERFFCSKLHAVDEPTAPFGLLDARAYGGEIKEAKIAVEPALAKRIRTQASRLKVTLAQLFHAGWGLVVAHTSGKDEVVFGSVFLLDRERKDNTAPIVDMFVNTLPLRLQLRGVTAAGLIEQTQRELTELLEYIGTSLVVAQSCSGIIGSAPLFESVFVYESSVPVCEPEPSQTRDIRVLSASRYRTNYPITCTVEDLGEEFDLTVQTDLRIDPDRVLRHFNTALESLIGTLEYAPEMPALHLPIIPPSERFQIETFNATAAEYPRDKRMQDLFSENAQRTPDAVAVVYGDQSLTYREIDERSNQLGHHLEGLGVGAETVVGLYMDRGPEMVVGVLGILKAGGAYLPLDPSYPSERLQFMLRDSQAWGVVSHSRVSLPESLARRVVQLDLHQSQIESAPRTAPSNAARAANLAYVMYTSGSTGLPKAVAMPHGPLISMLGWQQQVMPVGPSDMVAQFASFSFDVSAQEMFACWQGGGTLLILPDDVRHDPKALADLLCEKPVRQVYLTQTVMREVWAALLERPVERGPLQIVSAGEIIEITSESVAAATKIHASLWNHYGSTEIQVATAFLLDGKPEEWPTRPPIGQPIWNTQVHILDRHLRLVPIGVTGEIYVAGAGLARGYLYREDLTVERFIADPYGKPGERMYRTGDLGRYRPDGTIECLGRIDRQIKLRGFRVELGEIEAVLQIYPKVKQAVVVPHEDNPGEKRLIGYVVPVGEHIEVVELRTHLKRTLPEHMVPGQWMFLDQLPRTSTGKVDRRNLPSPSHGSLTSGQGEPAHGEIEETLAQIWKELLHVEQVAPQDDFFELGGHSMSALKMVAHVCNRFEIPLQVQGVLRNPTLRQFSQLVEKLIQPKGAGLETETGVI